MSQFVRKAGAGQERIKVPDPGNSGAMNICSFWCDHALCRRGPFVAFRRELVYKDRGGHRHHCQGEQPAFLIERQDDASTQVL